jgi:hypothetical protein
VHVRTGMRVPGFADERWAEIPCCGSPPRLREAFKPAPHRAAFESIIK